MISPISMEKTHFELRKTSLSPKGAAFCSIAKPARWRARWTCTYINLIMILKQKKSMINIIPICKSINNIFPGSNTNSFVRYSYFIFVGLGAIVLTVIRHESRSGS